MLKGGHTMTDNNTEVQEILRHTYIAKNLIAIPAIPVLATVLTLIVAEEEWSQ